MFKPLPGIRGKDSYAALQSDKIRIDFPTRGQGSHGVILYFPEVSAQSSVWYLKRPQQTLDRLPLSLEEVLADTERRLLHVRLEVSPSQMSFSFSNDCSN